MAQYKEIEYITMSVEVKNFTEKAVLITDEYMDDHWIPKACLSQDTLDHLHRGDMDIRVAYWFAKKEDLL